MLPTMVVPLLHLPVLIALEMDQKPLRTVNRPVQAKLPIYFFDPPTLFQQHFSPLGGGR
jgi:hypothetical protein